MVYILSYINILKNLLKYNYIMIKKLTIGHNKNMENILFFEFHILRRKQLVSPPDWLLFFCLFAELKKFLRIFGPFY